MIKKFKNGKLKLSAPKGEIDKYLYLDEEGNINEDYYHDVMFMSDLCINQIDGCMYLVDFNRQLVYPLYQFDFFNLLEDLFKKIQEEGKVYLYPVDKEEGNYLLKCLEGGY